MPVPYVLVAAASVLGYLVIVALEARNDRRADAYEPFGSPSGWWPDADQPVDLVLTEDGQYAVGHLDEATETWRWEA